MIDQELEGGLKIAHRKYINNAQFKMIVDSMISIMSERIASGEDLMDAVALAISYVRTSERELGT